MDYDLIKMDGSNCRRYVIIEKRKIKNNKKRSEKITETEKQQIQTVLNSNNNGRSDPTQAFFVLTLSFFSR